MMKVKATDLTSYIGNILERDFYFKGFCLVKKGEILTKDLVERLSSLELSSEELYLIDIVSDDTKLSSLSDLLVNQLYSKVQQIMKSYSFDECEDVNTVSEIMDSIISGIVENNCYIDLDIDALLIQQPDLCSHTLNTAILSALLAIKSSKFQRWLIEQITLGAILHDIGCAEIISEEGAQWKDIPQERQMEHPSVGYKIIENNSYIADSVKKIVLMHHMWEKPQESFDAEKGIYLSYPDSYAGKIIPEGTKSLSVSIVQTASTFENLINTSFDPVKSKKEAISTILRDSKKIYGEGALLLANYISPYSIGDIVQLNNGKEATVVKQTSSTLRPIISYSDTNEQIDLRKKPFIKIID